VRIAIADDAALFREGVARLLGDAGFVVTASVGDAAALMRAVAADPPDVAIIDIRMPPSHTTEGLEAAAEIRRRSPHVGVLLLSQYVESQHVPDLLASGGRAGYLLKERVTDPLELAHALRTIAEGGTVVDPAVVELLVGRHRVDGPTERLTPREREILALMAQGRSNRAIHDRLALSPKTVETHIGRIFDKLDLPPLGDDNRRVLAVLAFLRGDVQRRP
jgi:DNA-binding NarL/FixJ family response regulator